MISWYYILLDRQRLRLAKRDSAETSTNHEEEIPRWQKVFEDQFVISPSSESPVEYSYRDLAQWIQCIQPVLIALGVDFSRFHIESDLLLLFRGHHVLS